MDYQSITGSQNTSRGLKNAIISWISTSVGTRFTYHVHIINFLGSLLNEVRDKEFCCFHTSYLLYKVACFLKCFGSAIAPLRPFEPGRPPDEKKLSSPKGKLTCFPLLLCSAFTRVTFYLAASKYMMRYRLDNFSRPFYHWTSSFSHPRMMVVCIQVEIGRRVNGGLESVERYGTARSRALLW